MKVLFLALAFPNPDKTTNLYTDLVEEFVRNGDEIFVVAPYYDINNLGIQNEKGINVIRVKTGKLFNVGAVRKGIANILLPFQYIQAIKKYCYDINFDLIIMPTPPITLINVVKWLKKKQNVKMYLILRDIFPQNAVDLKMIKSGGYIHNYFKKKEKEVYRCADYIGCMSKGNIDYIVNNNSEIDKEKLHLLPNWEKLHQSGEVIDLNIKKEYGIDGKFVVIFGGNIGKPQKLENIIELAKSVENVKPIVFLIIGDGSEKRHIKTLVEKLKLKNVILKELIPRKDYNSLLSVSDVGLISLSENFTIPNIPSKSLSYFNAKKPILASIDLNTDFGTMIEEIGAGVWAEANNTNELRNKLMFLYENKDIREEMGNKGYYYLKENLTALKAYNTIKKNVF